MPAPDPGHSTIDIKKDYLVKYIGQIILVIVMLNNAAGDASTEDIQVSLEADLQ
jgi:hypothetical protein